MLESGEKASFDSLKAYMDTLDNDLKVSKEIYEVRLNMCKQCDFLISGMCLKCGCYVELRAVLKDKKCPNFDNRLW